ncbi:hypothetical protein Tco_1125719 [Tanacetum coccineum]
MSESSEAPPLAKRAKAGIVVKKRTVKSSKQLVDEFVDEGVPAAKPRLEDTKEAILQKVLEESLTDAYPTQRGHLPLVVFRETDTGKLQPLLEVPGKGKEKVGEEQAAQSSSLTSDSKKKEPEWNNIIFQRHTLLTRSLMKKCLQWLEVGSRRRPGWTRPCVLAGPNLEHSDVEITDASSQPQPEHMDEGFIATAYPEVQENLKLTVDEQMIPEEPANSTGTLSSLQHLTKDFSYGDQFIDDKSSKANYEKTTADTEAESNAFLVSSPTTTTTTTTLPLPPQPQQGPTDPILIKRIGELEEFIATLVEENQALETRLDKHGNRIHKMETMDWPKMIKEQTVEFIESQEIDQKINETVKEVVISSVKHAMRVPLHARFKDLPTSDMKEILLQRMLEENYDKGHAVHRVAYEALQDSIRHDECEDFNVDKAQEETKKKSKKDSPKTPPGLPPSPLPPPPPPPSSSTHQGGQSTSTAGPSSSKTAASAEYSAWTMTDTRIKPYNDS